MNKMYAKKIIEKKIKKHISSQNIWLITLVRSRRFLYWNVVYEKHNVMYYIFCTNYFALIFKLIILIYFALLLIFWSSKTSFA